MVRKCVQKMANHERVTFAVVAFLTFGWGSYRPLATAAPEVYDHCSKDEDCPDGYYCHGRFRHRICVGCNDCSRYNRKSSGKCAHNFRDCGGCLPGFVEEMLTSGEYRDDCILSDIRGNYDYRPLSSTKAFPSSFSSSSSTSPRSSTGVGLTAVARKATGFGVTILVLLMIVPAIVWRRTARDSRRATQRPANTSGHEDVEELVTLSGERNRSSLVEQDYGAAFVDDEIGASANLPSPDPPTYAEVMADRDQSSDMITSSNI